MIGPGARRGLGVPGGIAPTLFLFGFGNFAVSILYLKEAKTTKQ